MTDGRWRIGFIVVNFSRCRLRLCDGRRLREQRQILSSEYRMITEHLLTPHQNCAVCGFMKKFLLDRCPQLPRWSRGLRAERPHLTSRFQNPESKQLFYSYCTQVQARTSTGLGNYYNSSSFAAPVPYLNSKWGHGEGMR